MLVRLGAPLAPLVSRYLHAALPVMDVATASLLLLEPLGVRPRTSVPLFPLNVHLITTTAETVFVMLDSPGVLPPLNASEFLPAAKPMTTVDAA